MLAIQIGFDRTPIARLHIRYACANFQYLDSQLMAGNSWVRKERKFSEITSEVRTAYSDAVDPYQDFTRSGW